MQRISSHFKANTKILGVSILTSLDSKQTKKYYNNNNVKEIVSNFAKNALIKFDGIAEIGTKTLGSFAYSFNNLPSDACTLVIVGGSYVSKLW